ncbi:hypothetical protein BpHYR1_010104 [Brachionus plicatilis]|uniref:Uncharacterized protein n=1 Tax=Brachionus plicatilis TaxID=10195 RepID=A0A3M7S7H6_BRAPC|nr:hypothetical protein BpHYR1_010104 [Brachionus plicatilis]
MEAILSSLDIKKYLGGYVRHYLETQVSHGIYTTTTNNYKTGLNGESSRKAKIRILDHLYLIRKFKKYIRKSLVKSDLKQDIVRKSTETDPINFFLKFNIPIMNKKIPKIKCIRTLILKSKKAIWSKRASPYYGIIMEKASNGFRPLFRIFMKIFHNTKKINLKRKKEEIVRQQLHYGVGYSIYLDSKPALYSSTSLRTNGTELISPVLIYLSLNSQKKIIEFQLQLRLKSLQNEIK